MNPFPLRQKPRKPSNSTTSYDPRWLPAALVVISSAFLAVTVAFTIFRVPHPDHGSNFGNGLDQTNALFKGSSPDTLAIPKGSEELNRGPVQTSNIGEQPVMPPTPQLMSNFTLTPERVAAAFDCARQKHELPRYSRDQDLDREATVILNRILTDPRRALQDGEHGFTLTGQLMLDATYPQLSECMVGGFDVGRVEKLEDSSRIGIAMKLVPIYDQPLYLTIIIGY